ncbi:hypothetical protein NVV78_10510 [Pediococcus ethanolidurans]|uniref:hypothetical protein n=1 Tax=Pediococcus ethanolidurans TaxID=319653 RepID=UPI001C1EE3F5|nr:hypothetical protein [Pediococcus ethanolidurans]MBU7555866.1 hypothetical protein [Pediococcus ethanolidurans]MBU7564427.1 hypothetical protein [Pediococcus ethanolidurans]MCT4399087.1 hypothetical protein [Pediococcus ethanolidurans]MCV3316356.1 hypothetical protein [Pediococcus ethanolidurans]MCV3324625.1 hypothetical protein [Pediococcus ethanolidurans]
MKFSTIILLVLDALIVLGLLGVVINQIRAGSFSDKFWIGIAGMLAFGYCGWYLFKYTGKSKNNF